MVWLFVLIVAAALAFFGRDALRSFFAPPPRRAAARQVAADSLPGLSAQWLLAECGRLATAEAAWPAIAAALNPDADSEVESLLGRLRAAGMGESATILKAIEAGCREALKDNADASSFDALSAAARKSGWTSTAKG